MSDGEVIAAAIRTGEEFYWLPPDLDIDTDTSPPFLPTTPATALMWVVVPWKWWHPGRTRPRWRDR